ncbi:apolipoprotein L6-like [Astyanax mexicanus]|uniref:apolipoprotein L6-like n=1 Tax=Astyanax mexicanus TaxID=7994 RepID=UPI0020CAE963|nr:apolipoprotein L6-like [Astyanax mexicanus]
MSKPVPKPRKNPPVNPGEPSPTSNTPTYADAKPPIITTKPKRNVIVSGQPSPDMVPSISLAGQQSRVQLIVKSINAMEVNAVKSRTLPSITGAPNPSDIDTVTLERVTERVTITGSLWNKGTGSPSFFIPAANWSMPDMEDNEDLMEWWHNVEPWENVPNCHHLPKNKAAKTFTKKARHVKKAVRLYDFLLSEREDTLRGLTDELSGVADNLNKVYKGARIAGITGGAAGAAGVAAAVGGILLAPLTLGASLAVTAVGVGVAAAGGVTGASAAITNKVNSDNDRKKVEKILQDFTTEIEDIENCVMFIRSGIKYLNSHNLSELHGVDQEVVKVAKVAGVAGRNTLAICAFSKASGVIQGFALGMDIHFTTNDKQKLKKGSETKFAKQIREVAEKMKASLDELMKVKNDLKSADL